MTRGTLIAKQAQPASGMSARSIPPWFGMLDLAQLGGLVAAVTVWYGVSGLMGPVVPMPHQVIGNALGNLFSSDRLPGIGLPRGGYMPHLLYTAYDVLLGGTIGTVIGVTGGLLSAGNRIVSSVTAPLVSLLGTIPIVIMAPFFLMWFGLSGTAQVAMVAIYTATVLHLFSLRGARNLPAAFYDYASTLGAGPVTRFLRLRLPGALPEIFGGLRIAIAAAWGLSAVTEMLGGQYGSGRVLVALRSVYDLTGIMAVVLLLGLFAIIADGAILLARSLLLRWAPTGAASGTTP